MAKYQVRRQELAKCQMVGAQIWHMTIPEALLPSVMIIFSSLSQE